MYVYACACMAESERWREKKGVRDEEKPRVFHIRMRHASVQIATANAAHHHTALHLQHTQHL